MVELASVNKELVLLGQFWAVGLVCGALIGACFGYMVARSVVCRLRDDLEEIMCSPQYVNPQYVTSAGVFCDCAGGHGIDTERDIDV